MYMMMMMFNPLLTCPPVYGKLNAECKTDWRLDMSKFGHRNTRSAHVTGEQVNRMRDLYANQGWTQGALAREFDLSAVQVGRIVRNESWRGLAKQVTKEDARASEARFLARMQAEGLMPTPEPKLPEATPATQRAETAALSLEALMRREALKSEGGNGLQKLVDTADKVLAPERAVDEFLKED